MVKSFPNPVKCPQGHWILPIYDVDSEGKEELSWICSYTGSDLKSRYISGGSGGCKSCPLQP
ncbi:hypothetical protein DRP05_15475 [Archaeoglobales archaeon]|nr:MAG: hypothetical protein DRP05_15475 [Archaeoglobales archaeon]